MWRDTARSIRNGWRGRGTWTPVGHYYSPVSTARERLRQARWDCEAATPGIDLAEEAQRAWAHKLAERATNFAPQRWSPEAENNMFGTCDARILAATLAELRPSHIVEVGSGYSTAVMLDSADANGTTTDIACIEPYPDRLAHLLRPQDRVTLLRQPVQDVPLDRFTALGEGDLLFIDSTHVAKAGSDVIYLYLHVLPRLSPGVVVHVHDVFWPFSYPAEWLHEGRDWTEAYLLRALLTDTNRWQILLFGDWLQQHERALADRLCPGAGRPGSIYLRRR